METNAAAEIINFTALASAATSERESEMHRACARSVYRAVEWTDAETAEVRDAWSAFLDVERDVINIWSHRAWVGMA